MGEQLPAGDKLRSWVRRLRKRNLPQKNARTRLGDALNLTQTRWNLFPRHHQQHVIAYHHRGALIGERKSVGKRLLCVQAKPTEDSNLFVGGEQAKGASSAGLLRHSKQRAVPAADVYQIIAGMKIDLGDDAFVDEPRNFPFVSAPKRQVVRVPGALRGLAAIFQVVV